MGWLRDFAVSYYGNGVNNNNGVKNNNGVNNNSSGNGSDNGSDNGSGGVDRGQRGDNIPTVPLPSEEWVNHKFLSTYLWPLLIGTTHPS